MSVDCESVSRCIGSTAHAALITFVKHNSNAYMLIGGQPDGAGPGAHEHNLHDLLVLHGGEAWAVCVVLRIQHTGISSSGCSCDEIACATTGCEFKLDISTSYVVALRSCVDREIPGVDSPR